MALGSPPHRRHSMQVLPRSLVLITVFGILVLTSVAGMNIGRAELEEQARFDNQVILHNFIKQYLRYQQAGPDIADGNVLWGLLYGNPSTLYDSGLALKKRQDEAWNSGPARKRSTGAKRQQAWHVNYGKRYRHLSDVKGNQGWYFGYGKRVTSEEEPFGAGRWPSASMVLHPPWYDYGNKLKANQFVDNAKRQQAWHTSYGKRQQAWHNPYG
ncbi:uncharacterized protein LOC121382237 [Gigantopelta aegis]|uniref:uncharacterized protein LOC121382237 n=1 Tax=Gigantopelta aegis TaxID=1735272 RepID=UPI001B88C525|nr:uncharacterized protein LOC121382237 [Gigantopelta aegis]